MLTTALLIYETTGGIYIQDTGNCYFTLLLLHNK